MPVMREPCGKRRSRGVSQNLFLVSARGLVGSVRTGFDAVEVLVPLVAAAFADPGDQFAPVRVFLQQVQQLPTLREAVLLRDGEVLIESVPDGPREKARLFRVTAGAAAPCAANERTSSYARNVSSGCRKLPVAIALSVICRRAKGPFLRRSAASPDCPLHSKQPARAGPHT